MTSNTEHKYMSGHTQEEHEKYASLIQGDITQGNKVHICDMIDALIELRDEKRKDDREHVVIGHDCEHCGELTRCAIPVEDMIKSLYENGFIGDNDDKQMSS